MYKQFRSMRSIVISIALLTDIEKAISKRLKSTKYQIDYICEYNGMHDRSFGSNQDLKDCDNSLERSIKRLVMKVSVKEGLSMTLVFGKLTLTDLNSGYSSIPLPTPVNVYGEIQGASKDANDLWNDIDYQVRRHSKNIWYSLLSNAGVLFTLILTVILAKVYHHYFGPVQTSSIPILGIADKPIDGSTFWGSFWQYTQLYIWALASALCFRDIIKQLFSRVQFILGDNRDAVKRKQNLIERIIWDIIIAIVVGIVGAFIQAYIFG